MVPVTGPDGSPIASIVVGTSAGGGYDTYARLISRHMGKHIPGAPNIAKLSMSNIMRASRDLGLRIAGANGMLHGYTSEARAVVTEATGEPVLPHITELALFAQGPPIYGGTDQVQRNILGERALGLPKEPNEDKVKTWAELPRNG